MYSPRVASDKVQRLYKLREMIKVAGGKTNMIKMLNEALEAYLPIKEDEIRQKLNKSDKKEIRQ